MLAGVPRGYEAAAPGTVPDVTAVEAMMKYNESLQKAGVLIALDGLTPPSMGARVSFAGGRPKVSKAPFPGVREVLGGYWMIRVKSRDDPPPNRAPNQELPCPPAFGAGARRYKEPKDHGFMYEWGFEDLDGHIWEHMWMDPKALES
ncbi:MAG: YciI family protein [Myxococcota bacterium]